jgi:hypothetical protein
MRLRLVLAEQQNVRTPVVIDATALWREKAKPNEQIGYSTLPIRFTAATKRALSASTNCENSGASI